MVFWKYVSLASNPTSNLDNKMKNKTYHVVRTKHTTWSEQNIPRRQNKTYHVVRTKHTTWSEQNIPRRQNSSKTQKQIHERYTTAHFAGLEQTLQ